jgi:hypothetical protein
VLKGTTFVMCAIPRGLGAKVLAMETHYKDEHSHNPRKEMYIKKIANTVTQDISHLCESSHPADLVVELLNFLLVQILWQRDVGSPLVGAADLVPVGLGRIELGCAHDVDAAGLAQMQILKMGLEREERPLIIYSH